MGIYEVLKILIIVLLIAVIIWELRTPVKTKMTRQELIEWRDKVAGDMRKAISNVEMTEYDRLNTLYQKLDSKIRTKINIK